MFQDRLREIRQKRFVTTQEIADHLGVARSTYTGYERGHRVPNIEFVSEIAKYLKTSTDYLLCLTDDPSPKDPEKNINQLLTAPDLHFDGKPLTPAQLQPLRMLIAGLLEEVEQKSQRPNNSGAKTN